METVSYKTEKTETENGIEKKQTVSIAFNRKGKPEEILNVQRKQGITTISVTESEEHTGYPMTKFEATIEDDKLKQAANYLGEMFFNIGKLALVQFLNEDEAENKKEKA